MSIERAPACLAPCNRLSLSLKPRFGAFAEACKKWSNAEVAAQALEDAAAMTAVMVSHIHKLCAQLLFLGFRKQPKIKTSWFETYRERNAS